MSIVNVLKVYLEMWMWLLLSWQKLHVIQLVDHVIAIN